MSMSPSVIAQINREFIDMSMSPEGRTKIAEKAHDVIYTRVHENSSWDKILPPKTRTVEECQIDLETDSYYSLEEIAEEVDVALMLDHTGKPTGNYIQGERFKVPFFMISSERHWKTVQEIRAYKHPITDFIERSSANEIIRKKDAYGVALTEAAITATGKVWTAPGFNDLVRDDFVKLFNLLDGDELESKRLWMRQDDYNELLKWKSADLDIKSGETAWNGVQTTTLLGREIVTTIKNVFPKGTIYCFTDPEYFGKHYTLEDMKFELERRFNIIQFQSQLELGCNLGNIYSASKLIIPQA